MDQTIEMTSEQQAARDYASAMDSVNLLAAGKPETMSDEDWADCVKRNKDHLSIQLEKGAEYYGEHDLTPFANAISSNK
jgi:hypothetical protein